MEFTPLNTIALASLLLSFTRVTLPASARPVPSFTITASAPINHGVIFDITFALGVPKRLLTLTTTCSTLLSVVLRVRWQLYLDRKPLDSWRPTR